MSSAEVSHAGSEPRALRAPGLAQRDARPVGRWLQAGGLSEALGPLALALATAVVFWRGLVGGFVYYGQDTLSFYYPLTTWYAEQLRRGDLPLWFPYIFGGYPLFADGEIGMLYPLNVVLYGLLPVDVAFAWSRPIHFWLAATFTYVLARVLGAGRFGGSIAGLAFAFGSFLVGHIQHENIVRSTAWLPLSLACMELALRRGGRGGLVWLLACGGTVAMQLLGLHVQPVLLSLLALAGYAVFAPLGRFRWDVGHAASFRASVRGWRPRHERAPGYLAERGLAVGLVVVVAVGLAAVQLLPLYHLAERSIRFSGTGYEFSTTYSVPPTQLIQLVLPYLFRPDPFAYWGLWSAAETTLYVGIGPLLLALIALAYLRSRMVLFFGLLAGVSLFLALGDYLPVKLYGLISSLPGFSFLRVPGRFGLLLTLALAVLAGFGADWLAGRAFDRRGGERPGLRLRRLAALAALFGLGAVGLALLFLGVRAWLDLDPGGTRQAIQDYYLSLRRGEWTLTAWSVYFSAQRALDLGNPRTLSGLALMVVVPVLLLARAYHLAPRRAWKVALGVVVLVDLVVFAQNFYPQRPVGQLSPSHPAIGFLAERNGLHRVFVEPQLNHLLGPNQLVGARLDAAGGYSSLEPRRAAEYWQSVVRQDNVLLDLLNVRYVVTPRWVPDRRAWEGVLYHPLDRLMRGSVDNPSGTETFGFLPAWVERVSIVGSTEGMTEVGYGEPIAEIVLSGEAGEQRVLLRAGQHVEDGIAPLLGPRLEGEDPRPVTVWTGPVMQEPKQIRVLYGATLALERPMVATGLTIRRIGPPGALNVHGIGLHDYPGLPVRSLEPSQRSKYRVVYQDIDMTIFENSDAMPRAFVVGAARTAPGGTASIVDHLLLGPFDPRRTILVDGGPGEVDQASSGALPGAVEIVEYRPDRVVLRVEANEPAYVVLADRFEENWRGRVDGVEAPVLRADGMFRAVPVGQGAHEVALTYEPWAVEVGALVSAGTFLVVALGLGWLGVVGRRARRERWSVKAGG